MNSERLALTGWGRTAPSVAALVGITADELTEAGSLARLDVSGRGIIARGMGRSYGDPAQNGGGSVVRLAEGSIEVDADRSVAHVGAGVSLDTLLREIIPLGWFVPVTPGTRFVTVGGAIASDIHGKNHHVDGAFGSHVRAMTLLLADGSQRSLSPSGEHADLFWATVGGMGLTGIILDASFSLLPIETRHCVVTNERVPDFHTLIEKMAASDHLYRYSVAWIDLCATGRNLGRALLSSANHASLAELREMNPKAAETPLAYAPPKLPDVPSVVPNVFNKLSIKAFNELWYRKTPKYQHHTETLTGFFHPLDMVGWWNRLYGRNGFIQYQFVVPDHALDTLRVIVEKVAAHGHASFVNVLKRFGPASSGYLSFPSAGWTLTIDVPSGVEGLATLLAELDVLILGVGGRHYLAKDAQLTPDVIRAGYPRLDEWKAIRRTVDPNGRWASDLARRLELL
ncbi:MAG: FAD-binding oxidoreductase [Ilumatobacter sp.]|nr:FAD-binding oxidoreductase [Ilumatobacter sp.]